jgi:hypothetical protein
MPLPVLAATLGHANLRCVTKYVHMTGADIDAETLRIEAVRRKRKLDAGTADQSGAGTLAAGSVALRITSH